MEVTKREVLFSIVIICVLLLFGFLISDKINDSVMAENQEYNTALQINSDKDLFQYGMDTNVGNAFVYGDLKAVDTVTYPEIDGKYSYIEKVKEKHTRHTRVVRSGKRTRVQTYYTWDRVDSESKHSEKITFLDIEFSYGTIDFPSANYITTIKESSDIRYKYYGVPNECTGTLYAKLGDNTISNTHFFQDSTIEKTIENLKSGWQLILFWVIWIMLIIAIVIIFYYIDNRWLEDKKCH